VVQVHEIPQGVELHVHELVQDELAPISLGASRAASALLGW
jgi:hypothetical protein